MRNDAASQAVRSDGYEVELQAKIIGQARSGFYTEPTTLCVHEHDGGAEAGASALGCATRGTQYALDRLACRDHLENLVLRVTELIVRFAVRDVCNADAD